MLNRRILRMKVFKVLYSSVVSGDMSVPSAVTQLKESCEATRNLYVYMCGMVVPLTELAKERVIDLQNKINPTEEERNPNMKFCDNRLAEILSGSPDFEKIFKKLKCSWEPYDLYLRRLLDIIYTRDYYKQYMSSGVSSVEEDCELFVKIFEEEIVDSQGIDAILEDGSIYWNDDLAYALTQCCRMFREIGKGAHWYLPELYQSSILAKSGKKVEDDSLFAVKLLQSGFTHYSEYAQMVSDTASNWERERMYTGDIVLVALALSEIVTFPTIPVKVSMNEYVEISKYYCTPKSSVFVNGILDKLVKQLRDSGAIDKL